MLAALTNLRGGDVYKALVRKTEPKPLRVYMADTSGDIDNDLAVWPWANQLMSASLKYMGYDTHLIGPKAMGITRTLLANVFRKPEVAMAQRKA